MTRLRGRRSVKRAEDGGGDGYAEGGRGDGHAGAGFGGVKEAGEQGQQRLGAVELKKGADAARARRAAAAQWPGAGDVRLDG